MAISITTAHLTTAAVQGLTLDERLEVMDTPQGFTRLLLAGMTCPEIAETVEQPLEEVVNRLEAYLGLQGVREARLAGQGARQVLHREARKAAYWAVRGKAHEAAEVRRESHRVLSGFQARAACELAGA